MSALQKLSVLAEEECCSRRACLPEERPTVREDRPRFTYPPALRVWSGRFAWEEWFLYSLVIFKIFQHHVETTIVKIISVWAINLSTLEANLRANL